MNSISKETIEEINKEFEAKLLNEKSIPFSFDKDWSSKFANEPGVYGIFDKGALCYVGETADLKERMKDVKRTVNHTFRRKLGEKEFDGILKKKKFSVEVEVKLDDYYTSNLSFVGIPVHFGRIEIETYLINEHNATLLNSQGKRGHK